MKNNKLKSLLLLFILTFSLSINGCGEDTEPQKIDTPTEITSEIIEEEIETEDSIILTEEENNIISEEITEKDSEESTKNIATVNTSENQSLKETEKTQPNEVSTTTTISFDFNSIPAYSGKPYVTVNNNQPFFLDNELSITSFESYAALDSKGRCGVCVASIGKDIMPTEERGNIGSVKPTGWHTVKYDVVDGKYLYNRCHLIGYQLTAENANKSNLITGTRYLNVDGMLPFENMVADYIKETGNHVMYRVTPIFEGNNLLASGVLMEAKSVEDNGDGILFCVYCYNVQPGISINYADGNSQLNNEVVEEKKKVETPTPQPEPAPAPQPEPAPAPQPEPAPAPQPEPAPAPQPEPTPATQPVSVTVWKSATGEKYHSINNCGRMNPANATQLSEGDAIAIGLEKCTKCW